MSKKIIIIIISFIFVSILSSCKQKEIEKEIVEEDNIIEENIDDLVIATDTEPVFLDSLSYSLGDNLPTITVDSRVLENKLSDEDKENLLIASYKVLGKDLTINILKYKNDGHTIREALDAQINTYYPDQGLEAYIFDTFQNDFKCNYGYYMAYDTQSHDEPHYIQTYIFTSNDDFIEVDYWYKTTSINLFDDIYVDIPSLLLKEVNDIDIDNGEVLRYEASDLGGVADLSFYIKDYVDDYDIIINQYKRKYDDLKFEDYSFMWKGGEYMGLSLSYFDEVSADICHYDYILLINNGLYSICFKSDETNGYYNTAFIPSFLSSIK